MLVHLNLLRTVLPLNEYVVCERIRPRRVHRLTDFVSRVLSNQSDSRKTFYIFPYPLSTTGGGLQVCEQKENKAHLALGPGLLNVLRIGNRLLQLQELFYSIVATSIH